jgi:MtaA/CmuA family methyltransferase
MSIIKRLSLLERLPLMPITMQFACHLSGKKYSEYANDHEILVQSQIKVAEQFEFDHVSCISDPAREAADLGATLICREDSPPSIDYANALLSDKTKLVNLEITDPYDGVRMLDRIKAAELFKEKVGDEKIIEGWVEGPCAEGADLRGINALMMDFFEDPGFIRDLFEFTTELAWTFAKAQINAGVDVIGVGDAVCSLIGPQLYKDFVWEYEKRLIDRIRESGCAVRLHICGNISDLLGDIAKLKCDFIDIDYPVSISQARGTLGPDQMMAGNINPVAVLQDRSPDQIYTELEGCYKSAGSNYIVAAGCEITPSTSFENIQVLTDFAKSH